MMYEEEEDRRKRRRQRQQKRRRRKRRLLPLQTKIFENQSTIRYIPNAVVNVKFHNVGLDRIRVEEKKKRFSSYKISVTTATKRQH